VGDTHARKCNSPGKAPWGPWKEFQTRLPTAAELRRKWRDNPRLNVGIALGGVTGLIGLDVDGDGGEELLLRLANGDLPPTLEFTSGKGRRLLYRVPAGVELRPTPKPGGEQVEGGELRLLGLGSQTVMPPSRHKDTGRRYAWTDGRGPGEIEPPVAPAWVVGLMRVKGDKKLTRRTAPGGSADAPSADAPRVAEGGRNTTLTSLAGAMRRKGMGEAAIRAALREVNRSHCDPPLDEAEVDTIAASVAKYPPGGAGAPGSPGSPYSVEGGRVCRRTFTKDGVVLVPLSNFGAKITEEVRVDDGSPEVQRTFTVEGALRDGTPLPAASVRATDFPGMNWVLASWGVRAIVSPGQGNKDHLRAALQELSGDARHRTVYKHTGWREIDGAWTYLHAGGGITARGLTTAVNVELDGKLAGYDLPEPPAGPDLAAAVRASLDLLGLAAPRLTAPGLGAVYRAPLGALDAALFYDGPTGAGKSEWAALCQQHFGAGMDRLNLPGAWTSTANAIEAQMFLVKDALFVLDDFKPGGGRSELDSWHSKADRVFRSQGNRSARQRCWADGTVRSDRPPRCLVLSTGEDRPRGESCAARRLDVRVQKGGIVIPGLTPYQEKARAGVYARAMAGYLQWLAGRLDKVRARLREENQRLRDLAASDGHPRTPGIVAELACGWKFFLDFAEEAGAVTAEEREGVWAKAWTGLLAVARRHEDEIADQEPARRFLRLLASAVSSGRAHVAGPRGEAPKPPLAWGWQSAGPDWRPAGKCVGWVERRDLYLDPESAYAAAQQLAEEQGEPLPVTQRQLHKRLDEQGFLASKEQGKLTNRRKVLGKERPVLHLRSAALSTPAEAGEPGEPGGNPRRPRNNPPVLAPEKARAGRKPGGGMRAFFPGKGDNAPDTPGSPGSSKVGRPRAQRPQEYEPGQDG
jgi:hypothetical protein